jgi:hypothetical protein
MITGVMNVLPYCVQSRIDQGRVVRDQFESGWSVSIFRERECIEHLSSPADQISDMDTIRDAANKR